VKKLLVGVGTLVAAAVFSPIAALLLSAIGLFLAIWIVVPAPTFSLLPLGVGAPEVSPWLLVLNAIAAVLALKSSKLSTLGYAALMGSAIALVLSSLPIVQLPGAIRTAEAAMVQALGQNYDAPAPNPRPQPFGLLDAFRGIPTADVRYTAGIPFAQPDGVALKLDVYRPPQTGQYPAIVLIYGGAWREGNSRLNPEFNRYMAARGYVVWAISYRHAPHYRFPAQLEDVRSALAFVRQHAAEYETDPDRLALMGRSAGAHLAMLGAYKAGALPVRAVVNYYGPIDLTIGYYDLPQPDPIDSRTVLRTFLGGTPEEFPDLYRAASPINDVTRSLPPTLLIYGGRDHLVQAKFGRQMGDRLRSTGTTAVFLEIPWAEHAFDAVFSGVSNQVALYYTERFLAWALKSPQP
jgi:acetyl esterase/lipase